MNNILIIGSGAREHAIAKTLAKTSPGNRIYCYGASKNPGIMKLVAGYRCGNLADFENIRNFAQSNVTHLAIIGPEAPLEKGLVDFLKQHQILCVGPTKNLAQLETSKSFTRNLLKKYHIQGSPEFQYFDSIDGVETFLEKLGPDGYVIKADGLMGGKGVKVASEHLHSFEEALTFCRELIEASHSFLIEEKCVGQEFSLLCFSDGHTLIPMPLVQDHKRAYDGDKGPNTGGMGSYSCANHRLPFVTEQDMQQAMEINQQVIKAIQKECGELYQGILYGSFMATKNGIKLIEYNVRFGDPEAINILSLFTGDFARLCFALTQGCLKPEDAQFQPLATVCKYAVPLGYPDNPVQNTPIDVSFVTDPDSLFYAAIDDDNGNYLATGSRAIAVLGQGESLEIAENRAENAIACIRGSIYYRKDIGTNTLLQTKIQQMQDLRLGTDCL